MSNEQQSAPVVVEERELRPEHIVKLNQLLMLLAHHDDVKAGLNQQIAMILNIGYGADMVHENWNYDAARGVIQKLGEPQQMAIVTDAPAA